MPIEYESTACGPIFGMASAASYDKSNCHAIPNIRPHRHSGIHIALQGNNRTGVNRRQCYTLLTANNISAIIVSRLFRGAKLEQIISLAFRKQTYRFSYMTANCKWLGFRPEARIRKKGAVRIDDGNNLVATFQGMVYRKKEPWIFKRSRSFIEQTKKGPTV